MYYIQDVYELSDETQRNSFPNHNSTKLIIGVIIVMALYRSTVRQSVCMCHLQNNVIIILKAEIEMLTAILAIILAVGHVAKVWSMAIF